jgi:hypothetical protein
MKVGLENITVNDLNDRKVKIINEMLRGDKRLSLETINSYNQAMAPLFAFSTMLVKSYENGKKLSILEEEEL